MPFGVIEIFASTTVSGSLVHGLETGPAIPSAASPLKVAWNQNWPAFGNVTGLDAGIAPPVHATCWFSDGGSRAVVQVLSVKSW